MNVLGLGYFTLSFVLTLCIAIGYYKAGVIARVEMSRLRKQITIFVSAIILWILYLYLLQLTDILSDSSLPPKMPILVIFPFVLISIFLYRKNKNNPVLAAMPKSWLVYIQTFRVVVELLILFTFIEGVMPISATFEGYNFDIFMGLTAPLVAYFLFSKGVKNVFLAKAYNLFGIAMILLVAVIIVTSFYQPQLWGSEVPLVADEFFKFPYLLLAGFLAPMGILFHVMSIRQLTMKTEKK